MLTCKISFVVADASNHNTSIKETSLRQRKNGIPDSAKSSSSTSSLSASSSHEGAESILRELADIVSRTRVQVKRAEEYLRSVVTNSSCGDIELEAKYAVELASNLEICS